MAENEPKSPVIQKAGVPTAGRPGFIPTAAGEGGQQSQQQQQNDGGGAAASAAAASGAAASAPASGSGGGTQPQTPDFESIKTFLKTQGIEGFESVDDLKGLVTKATAPPPKEPTAEEKAAAEAKMDERMLGLYMKNGGKVEDYVALKSLATQDLKDLSRNEVIRELKALKFGDKPLTDDQIAQIISERYYTANPDDLQKGQDEDDAAFEARRAFAKFKATYGSQTMENRALPIRKRAESLLQGLRDALAGEDATSAREQQLSAEVDKFATDFNRTVSIDLGKLKETDEKPVDPFSFTVPDEVLTEIATTLKDPAKRQQLLFNPDSSFNLAYVGRLMAIEKYLTLAARESFLQGGNRQVAEFEKTFGGRTPQSLGVGGNTNTRRADATGSFVKAGKPQAAGAKP